MVLTSVVYLVMAGRRGFSLQQRALRSYNKQMIYSV